MSTVSNTFGLDVADKLAAFAIDLACAAPENISTYYTRVPAGMIGDVRAALEDAGIDWRKLVRSRIEQRRERARKLHEDKQ